MGRCVIINNENFTTGSSKRLGTDVDAASAKKIFEELGYKVNSKKDHKENSSFVCVILSHGNQKGIFATDELVELDSLTECLKGNKCPDLIGKPKLFFVQACRGEKTDGGVDIKEEDGVDATLIVESESKSLPVEADFLYAYSTPPGFYAWRSNSDGSWFIQALCEYLRKYKDLELMDIMTRVSHKVACHKRSQSKNNADLHLKKVVPCITSMLTKDWYFTE
ncbi:hypothetical protein WMY93_020548 [Mugilogobius chulae]|uniref:Caspase-3 n=1 Tax=Mugilogobius chulae TaxID=88201 RepID=A0AAW0N865_9GOBI